MKTLVMATLALVGMTAVASAQTKPVVSTNVDNAGFYTGAFLGSATHTNDRITAGVNAGYQFNRFLRTEVVFDHAWKSNVGAGSRATLNAIGQYRIPGTTITPYVLAGAGYAFDSLGSVKKGGAVPVYTFGAGTRVAVSERVDLDLRYRNIRAINDTNARVRDGHLLTVGATYKF